MSSLVAPALVAGLLDDAAVFPPGLAPMPEAVAAHTRHSRSWYAGLIGPFLVPVAQLPSFQQALDEEVPESAWPLAVSLVADRTAADPLPALLAAVHDLGGRPDVEIDAVEVALRPGPAQPSRVVRLAATLVGELPDGVVAWVEVNRGDDLADALSALAESGSARAKFRTGGTEASAVPSADELALVLQTAVDVSLPLKLTAGLHSALPGTDPVTGFPHHGFLTVLAAVAAAQDGARVPDLAPVLREGDAAAVTRSLQALDDDACQAVRSVFRSFGCCGVTDPVDDLVRLGLLDPGAPDSRHVRPLTTRREGVA